MRSIFRKKVQVGDQGYCVKEPSSSQGVEDSRAQHEDKQEKLLDKIGTGGHECYAEEYSEQEDTQVLLKELEERQQELQEDRKRLEWRGLMRWFGMAACFVVGWFMFQGVLAAIGVNRVEPTTLQSSDQAVVGQDQKDHAQPYADDNNTNTAERADATPRQSVPVAKLTAPIRESEPSLTMTDVSDKVRSDVNDSSRARNVFKETLSSIQKLND